MGAGSVDGDLGDADVVVFATPDDAIAAAAGAHPQVVHLTLLGPVIVLTV